MLKVLKSKLSVRENEKKGCWEVLSVIQYSDYSVQKTVICERDSLESAMALIEKEYA